MPSGTISLPPFTATTSVNVTITAVDADQIQLSNDATWPAEWTPIPASNTLLHVLTSGDGQKTVFARFRLASVPDVVSPTVQATTVLDSTAPSGTLYINDGAPITTSPVVTLTLAWNDTSDPSLGQARYKNETGDFSPWEPINLAVPKAWALTAGNGAKTVTVQLKDAAGNVSTTTISAAITLYATTTGKWTFLKTPDYDPDAAGEQTSYLRLGAANYTEEGPLLDRLLPSDGDADDFYNKVNNATRPESNGVRSTVAGWLEYTDGVRTEVTKQSRVTVVNAHDNIYVRGDLTTTVGGKKTDNIGGEYRVNVGQNSAARGTMTVYNADPIYWVDFRETDVFAGGKKGWRQTTKGHLSADSYTFGDVESFFGGYKFDGTFGLTTGIFIGGKIDVSAAATLAVNFGYNITWGGAINYNHVEGKDLRFAGDAVIKGRKTVSIRVKPDLAPTLAETAKWGAALAILGAGTVAGALVGGIGAAYAPNDASEGNEKGTTSAGAGGSLGVAAGLFAVGLIISVVFAIKAKSGTPAPSPAEILVTKKKIHLMRNLLAVPMAELEVAEDAAVAGGGFVQLSNNKDCWLELNGKGAIVANGKKEITLQTENGKVMLTLAKSGTMTMKMKKLEVNGTEISLKKTFIVK